MTDPMAARALRDLDVPEHGPAFWHDLEQALGEEPYRHPVRHRRRRPFFAGLAVAAALVALALVGVPRSAHHPVATDRQEVRRPEVHIEDIKEVAERFVAAARAGDLEAVADLVGPRSKAYADANGASVSELLHDAVPAGLGPDATTQVFDGPTDQTRIVAVRDGDVVAALPTWQDPETGHWFVEPWALDPATGDRIVFRSPDAMSAGDLVRVDVPVDGQVRIATSQGLSVLIPTSRLQAGVVPPAGGGEQVVVAAIDTGTALSATVQLLFVDPEPASAQGAGALFMYRWWLGDEAGMARYGTADAVAQAEAIRSNGSRYDHFSCEGAAGSTYCTWHLADGRRFVLRVANLERPLRVVEFRLDDT
jgi:hypothetical protein